LAPAEIVRRIQRLVTCKRRADRQRAAVEDRLRQAVIDPLTGLYNRRFALPQLAQIGQRAAVDGTDFAAFVVDIDRFKQVNDRFGHAAGDAVLVEVAQRLTANLRAGDLLARIGGEEFLAVLPDISLTVAQGIAERLCHAMASEPFCLPDGTPISVTVSIGMAISTASRPDRIGGLIDDADHALMAAKSAGRNQVTLSRSAA
jgi:two-component system, cell cycle response regulator